MSLIYLSGFTVHVEEFKKELGREVMAMTNEVSRLQRERQMLEQQIADLFAFFAKQRAEMVRLPSSPCTHALILVSISRTICRKEVRDKCSCQCNRVRAVLIPKDDHYLFQNN